MMTNHIERTAFWRLVQASVLVVTVGLLPLGIGCNNENSPSASDPSAKEGGTETTFKLSGAENNEDASDGERPTQNGGVDWHALMATPPEEWSDELKTQITAAGYDLDETTVGIRKRQAWAAVAQTPAEEWTQEQRNQLIEAGLDPEEVAAQMLAAEERDGRSADEDEALREFQRGVTERAMAIPPEEWNDRLKAAIVQAGWDLDEFTEGIRQRQASQRARMGIQEEYTPADDGSGDEDEALREFQRGVAERAMAIPPEEWNDRLKAAIVRAGWDLDEFTEGIRQRQARQADSED